MGRCPKWAIKKYIIIINLKADSKVKTIRRNVRWKCIREKEEDELEEE